MTPLPDDGNERRTKILDELLYEKPLNKDLQIVDSIFTKLLRGADQPLRRELQGFLERWQFRVDIAHTLQDATDEEWVEAEKSDHAGA